MRAARPAVAEGAALFRPTGPSNSQRHMSVFFWTGSHFLNESPYDPGWRRDDAPHAGVAPYPARSAPRDAGPAPPWRAETPWDAEIAVDCALPAGQDKRAIVHMARPPPLPSQAGKAAAPAAGAAPLTARRPGLHFHNGTDRTRLTMDKVATLAELRPTSAINLPDTKVVAREAFGIDTDMVVPAFSRAHRARAGHRHRLQVRPRDHAGDPAPASPSTAA